MNLEINNNFMNKIIFYNYLETSWKEEKHLAWRLAKKNNIFFNNIRNTGFLINKNSNVNYKIKFLSTIIIQYLYSIRKHLKLYSLFLLFFKKFKKKKYYKNNVMYFKKKNKIGFFRKKKIRKYKKYYLLWYRKWFKKKHKKFRKILWNKYHRVPSNFWGRLLKKRTKLFIFNFLKSVKFKKKLFLKNYNDIAKMIFFFIRRKKGKRIKRKKLNKKYRINKTIPVFLQKIEYLQKRNTYQTIFPTYLKKNYYLEKLDIDNRVEFSLDNLSSTNFFLNNYNYYIFLLNLKCNNIFNIKKNIIFYFYKALRLTVKKTDKYKYIRMYNLNFKLEHSNIKHGNNVNIFIFWQEMFFKKHLIKYKYISKNLLNNCNLINFFLKLNLFSLLKNKLNTHIVFEIKNKKNVFFKNYFKCFFYCDFLGFKKNKKKNVNLSNNWYQNLVESSRKNKKKFKNKKFFNNNRKMHFYPFRVKNRLKKNKFFKKKVKSEKVKFNVDKKIIIKFLFSKKNNKFRNKKKKIIYKYFRKMNKKLNYYNINQQNVFFSKFKFLKRKKKHFLKKYKRKIKRKMFFFKYGKKYNSKYKKNKFFLANNKKKFFFVKKLKNMKKNNKKKKNKKIMFIFKRKNKFTYKIKNKFILKSFMNIKNKMVYKEFLLYNIFFKKYLKKKKKYKKFNILNVSNIYRELMFFIIFKLKNRKFFKYRNTLSFISYNIKTKNNNVLNNFFEYSKFGLKLDNYNKKELITNINIYSVNFKNVYSNLLVNYYEWISLEISKTLFFSWLYHIKTII